VAGVFSCRLVLSASLYAQTSESVHWTRNRTPTEATIQGGPWTLEQSGATNGLKTAGCCDASGNQIGNPGSERMQPYYFPNPVKETICRDTLTGGRRILTGG
jgi:hypothetical protein